MVMADNHCAGPRRGSRERESTSIVADEQQTITCPYAQMLSRLLSRAVAPDRAWKQVGKRLVFIQKEKKRAQERVKEMEEELKRIHEKSAAPTGPAESKMCHFASAMQGKSFYCAS